MLKVILLGLVSFQLAGCRTILARIRHEDREHVEMAMRKDLEEYKVVRPEFFEPLQGSLISNPSSPKLSGSDEESTVAVEMDTSGVRCSNEERSIWFQNPDFTKEYLNCSAKKLGQPGPVGICLHEVYPTLSVGCGECLGEASLCAAKKCFRACIRNQGSPGCRKCFNEQCNQGLLECSGANDASELPMPPEDKDKVAQTTPPSHDLSNV